MKVRLVLIFSKFFFLSEKYINTVKIMQIVSKIKENIAKKIPLDKIKLIKISIITDDENRKYNSFVCL